MQTYLFYDIETTGLSPCFDQVLQFAAIRTNLNLEEIERHEINIKLNCDVVPSPVAMITHQLSLNEISLGLSEYEAIQKIHRLLNYPGTISVGYNTLGFDDEFLRFSFYRNLLPPYTHQYANQCGRMDIYPIAIFYFLFRNEILTWPVDSLKLEKLNEVNHLISGRSHHALIDVEVTLALARIFYQDKEMWNFIKGYFDKQIDQKRCQSLKEGIMVNGVFGSQNAYQSSVFLLGEHRHYKNQTVWVRMDYEEFNASEIKYSLRKKWGEPHFVLPKSDRFLRYLSKERLDLIEKNQQHLSQKDFFEKTKNQHLEFTYPVFPNADAQARLYMNGFWTKAEENFCFQFHKATSKEKIRLTKELQPSTLKTLASRILARHFPEILVANERDFFETLNNENAIDYKGIPKLNKENALQEIKKLKENLSADDIQQSLLESLHILITNHFYFAT